MKKTIPKTSRKIDKYHGFGLYDITLKLFRHSRTICVAIDTHSLYVSTGEMIYMYIRFSTDKDHNDAKPSVSFNLILI